MTIRVGESWPTRNGHRRWVSMSLGDLLALGAGWVLFIGPFWLLWKLFLLELWITAEALLFLGTGILVSVALVKREARLRDVTVSVLRPEPGPGDARFRRARWGLVMLDLKARP